MTEESEPHIFDIRSSGDGQVMRGSKVKEDRPRQFIKQRIGGQAAEYEA